MFLKIGGEDDVDKWILIVSKSVNDENFFRVVCGYDNYETEIRNLHRKVKSHSETNYELLEEILKEKAEMSEKDFISTIHSALNHIGLLNVKESMIQVWNLISNESIYPFFVIFLYKCKIIYTFIKLHKTENKEKEDNPHNFHNQESFDEQDVLNLQSLSKS